MRDTTIHKASWIPREFHGQSKYTYDTFAKRFVRITIGEEGAYSVATAPMPVGNKKTIRTSSKRRRRTLLRTRRKCIRS